MITLKPTILLKAFASTLAFAIFLLHFTAFCPAAEPKRKAVFKEVTATTSDTHLLIFGTLDNSFTPEMTAILQSGITLKFNFFIELYKIKENWPEEQVISLTFQHLLNYDTLKESYRITLEEENFKTLPFKSLADAQKVLNELNGARVVNLKQLIPDNRYKLKVRAELYQKTLPLSLHNILPFLAWWDVATDWHSIEFKY